MHKVILTKVEKDLKYLPKQILIKLKRWIDLVEEEGMAETRKIPGFHDEPLKGQRKGQRSIRLSLSYRAIYFEVSNGQVILVHIEEVNNHDY